MFNGKQTDIKLHSSILYSIFIDIENALSYPDFFYSNIRLKTKVNSSLSPNPAYSYFDSILTAPLLDLQNFAVKWVINKTLYVVESPHCFC